MSDPEVMSVLIFCSLKCPTSRDSRLPTSPSAFNAFVPTATPLLPHTLRFCVDANQAPVVVIKPCRCSHKKNLNGILNWEAVIVVYIGIPMGTKRLRFNWWRLKIF